MARQAATARPKGKAAAPRMAARRTSPGQARPQPDLSGLSPDRQIAVLKKDRDALAAALVVAETRIAALEARQNEVADRIAWALDTLRDLMQNR